MASPTTPPVAPAISHVTVSFPVAFARTILETDPQTTETIEQAISPDKHQNLNSASDDLSLAPSEETTTSDTPATELLKFYLLLNWYLLLALARHDEKPIIDPASKGRVQLFDAFMSGYINDEGVTQLPPMRDIHGYVQFDADRLRLVPDLIALVEEKNNANFSAEPRNRIVPGTSARPVQDELWKLVITPSTLDVFATIVKKSACKEQLSRGDIDPWKLPGECGQLISFLNNVVKQQYDFKAWQHVMTAKPNFLQEQKLRGPDVIETFEWVSDRPGEIFAVVLAKVPGKTYYFSQSGFIPERNDRKEDLDKNGKPRGYCSPNPEEYRIPNMINLPRTDTAMLWTPIDRKRKFWKRADGRTWTCLLIARRLAFESDRYVQVHVLTLDLIATIDPNNVEWKKKYNKFWRQVVRRYSGVNLVTRDHWTAEEKNVVYEYLNDWCFVKGVDAFRDNCLSAAEKTELTVKVNAVRNCNRQKESIRSFIHNQIKHNKYGISALCDKAAELRERIEREENVEKGERHPINFIALLDTSERWTLFLIEAIVSSTALINKQDPPKRMESPRSHYSKEKRLR
ncbi:hypothetical protein T440DRAFT_515799 [Plenodomus tracheiphilus IPT5]|uniref:Uncharacterized protein n=1 Tax=Plenodomus tracheiphilus IPT5 TaxID=1408161 RepID=A0A6A7BFA2_9PLEO|nr:hypothetical protein T440DRAFT_515799 [Plenodomus tracheiphilus IPT5]